MGHLYHGELLNNQRVCKHIMATISVVKNKAEPLRTCTDPLGGTRSALAEELAWDLYPPLALPAMKDSTVWHTQS
jgi:hypothetical protein